MIVISLVIIFTAYYVAYEISYVTENTLTQELKVVYVAKEMSVVV